MVTLTEEVALHSNLCQWGSIPRAKFFYFWIARSSCEANKKWYMLSPLENCSKVVDAYTYTLISLCNTRHHQKKWETITKQYQAVYAELYYMYNTLILFISSFIYPDLAQYHVTLKCRLSVKLSNIWPFPQCTTFQRLVHKTCFKVTKNRP